MVFTLNSR